MKPIGVSRSVLAAFCAGGAVAATVAVMALAQPVPAPTAPTQDPAAGQAADPATQPAVLQPGAAPGQVQPVAVQPALPPLGPFDPNDPWLWGDQALLRGLDKVTAETRDFIAPIGEDVQFFALTVSVKRCAKRPPERTPETIVGMEIHDRQTDGEGGEAQSNRIFSGWMFGSSPALNPLEHPVYDVWVLDCIDSRIPPPPEPSPEELAAEEQEADEEVLPGQVFD